MPERWWNLELTVIRWFDTEEEAWAGFDEIIDPVADTYEQVFGSRREVMRGSVAEVEDGEPISPETGGSGESVPWS
jgi:hypothetical protein